MIENEKQYQVTKEWAEKFADSVAQINQEGALMHLDPDMRRLFQDAYESQAEELRAQLAEYEELRDGHVTIMQLNSLAELPDALIRARATSRLTQQELAARLGIEEKQIQQYEATRYATANLEQLQAIAAALGVKISERVVLQVAAVTGE